MNPHVRTLGVVDADQPRARKVSRGARGSGRVVEALDALCHREGGALARLKAATEAYVAELCDHALPRDLAVDTVTDLVAACWSRGSVPAPAPLVREALVDVVASWCADELGDSMPTGRGLAVHRLD